MPKEYKKSQGKQRKINVPRLTEAQKIRRDLYKLITENGYQIDKVAKQFDLSEIEAQRMYSAERRRRQPLTRLSLEKIDTPYKGIKGKKNSKKNKRQIKKSKAQSKKNEEQVKEEPPQSKGPGKVKAGQQQPRHEQNRATGQHQNVSYPLPQPGSFIPGVYYPFEQPISALLNKDQTITFINSQGNSLPPNINNNYNKNNTVSFARNNNNANLNSSSDNLRKSNLIGFPGGFDLQNMHEFPGGFSDKDMRQYLGPSSMEKQSGFSNRARMLDGYRRNEEEMILSRDKEDEKPKREQKDKPKNDDKKQDKKDDKNKEE